MPWRPPAASRRADQLIAPDEHQWRKTQGAGDEKVPLIGVNVTQQFTHAGGVGNGRMMAVGGRGESAAQIRGNVVFRPSGDNGIAKYPPGITQCLVGNGQRVPFLHPTENGQQLP